MSASIIAPISPVPAAETSEQSHAGADAPAAQTASPEPLDAIHFSPPEHIAVQILEDLAGPDCSFEHIASKASTTVVALTLWMTRPDIASRIDALESAFARRSRLTIAGYTGFMLGAIGRVIEEYNDAESRMLHREGDLKSRALLARNRENVIDAGKLLLRLATAFPAPPTSPAPGRKPADRASAAEHPTTPRATPPDSENLHDLRAARFPNPPSELSESADSAPTPHPTKAVERNAMSDSPSHEEQASPASPPTPTIDLESSKSPEEGKVLKSSTSASATSEPPDPPRSAFFQPCDRPAAQSLPPTARPTANLPPLAKPPNT